MSNIDKISACEIGEMVGRRRLRTKPKKCKHRGCITNLNSYHKGRYCHTHEAEEFIQFSSKRCISSNQFHKY
jgi:hypothetical protein